jgi:GNAT superfamily N-acetyltransferase
VSLVATGTLDVVRVTAGVHWHALEDDVVVGRGHALHRPDGRVFLSVDTWRDDVFAVLAEAMVGDLPAPVFTVVDEDDREVLARWSLRGFRDHRREVEFAVPTAPELTGLDGDPPPGVRVLAAAAIDPAHLRDLDALLRAEIARDPGWDRMPPQLRPPPAERERPDPTPYLVAVVDGAYAGLARIAPLPRRPRLGLLAVRTAYRRRGLARALLTTALRDLHERGIPYLGADVDGANEAATALVTGIGGTPVGASLELVR